MTLDIFVVDAFTNEQFKGNSAAVVPLKQWLSNELMQAIAAENNLSETAFFCQLSPNKFHIRWFSPITEIDFCGHATLATSFVLFNFFQCQGEVTFTTEKVGDLQVKQAQNQTIEMVFPNLAPTLQVDVPQALYDGLSIKPLAVLRNQQAYLAVFRNEKEVASVKYHCDALKQLAPYDVAVTAQGESFDFVSRYFWPANGGDEDPVTGSIHAALAPYWAKQLNKNKLVAYQASKRGGVLNCQVSDDSVIISGQAVLYLKGEISV